MIQYVYSENNYSACEAVSFPLRVLKTSGYIKVGLKCQNLLYKQRAQKVKDNRQDGLLEDAKKFVS